MQSWSGLPEQRLLGAAHIIADKDECLGQPIVSNGLSLSKIHHAAFNAHLIGFDPDYRVHVSERLLGQHDGPMLESAEAIERWHDPPAGSRRAQGHRLIGAECPTKKYSLGTLPSSTDNAN